ncbi:hypothetical protein C4J95_0705 [Pseudomonas orientalis]|uniref:YscO family type III secretion system apparatus protein n=1 Tax=Pseudomonas orientalis TaxID=76758 RepID=UPI000F5825B5|nr:YscO family type III secretion system apparatus protein [Pseudomonas orientalis]AZE92836.1 hypothetical protein C4J96_0696 [Pseudomonas orientalis]AZE98189.1 hypothetical protein C4J95_0705 [Pseudomonas orientalis]
MSLSEPLKVEIETLRRLRRHRADRVERELSAAKRHQRALLAQIEQAQQVLEQTRVEEARRTEQLLKQHQGTVMTFKDLKAWGAQERSLSASTQREVVQLQSLHGQREQQEIQVSLVQKRVTECLREVEKLHELAKLLAEEDT